MQLVFLGYGVGKFELEFIRGSPQLSDVTALKEAQRNTQQQARASSFTEEEAEIIDEQPVAARFDLSFIPSQPAPVQKDGRTSMRSSWATDESATSSMDPAVLERAADRRKEREQQRKQVPWYEQQRFQNDEWGQMGDPEADANEILKESRKPKAKPGSSFDPAAALAAAPALIPTPAAAAAPAVRSNAIKSVLPQEMHLIVQSSVVVYQNCLVR